MKSLIAAADLLDLMDYNSDEGTFTWRRRGRPFFDNRFAGTPALNVQNRDGYLCGAIGGRQYLAHRVAWATYYGEWPDGQMDHINGIRNDNRIANLRVVTAFENQKNRGIPNGSKSGVLGVSWRARSKSWQVYICVDGRRIYVGSYQTIPEAAAAREAADRKYGFHPNHGKRIAHPEPRKSA